MEGLENIDGLFKTHLDPILDPNFRLNGDIQFALFVYMREIEKNKKSNMDKVSKEHRKIKRRKPKNDEPK